MRLRWRLILPCSGLIFFALGSYQAFRQNREHINNGKYFWWSSIRLDRDPLYSYSERATPCKDGDANCVQWDPGWMSVEPGWAARLFLLASAPAFALGIPLVRLLGRSGTDQVSSFMTAMPLLIGGWYYLVGWLVDRRACKRTLRI